jgi:hypothetical protein
VQIINKEIKPIRGLGNKKISGWLLTGTFSEENKVKEDRLLFIGLMI